MYLKRGSVHISLALILLVVGFWVVVIYFFLLKDKVKLPGIAKVAKVELKTEYKNPFDKETQYVNPFLTYKNPFNNL